MSISVRQESVLKEKLAVVRESLTKIAQIKPQTIENLEQLKLSLRKTFYNIKEPTDRKSTGCTSIKNILNSLTLIDRLV